MLDASMVEPKPQRWLYVFPTTAAFSTLSAIAAMLLLISGGLLLFTQLNMSATAPMPQSTGAVAIAPTTQVAATLNAQRQDATDEALANQAAQPESDATVFQEGRILPSETLEDQIELFSAEAATPTPEIETMMEEAQPANSAAGAAEEVQSETNAAGAVMDDAAAPPSPADEGVIMQAPAMAPQATNIIPESYSTDGIDGGMGATSEGDAPESGFSGSDLEMSSAAPAATLPEEEAAGDTFAMEAGDESSGATGMGGAPDIDATVNALLTLTPVTLAYSEAVEATAPPSATPMPTDIPATNTPLPTATTAFTETATPPRVAVVPTAAVIGGLSRPSSNDEALLPVVIIFAGFGLLVISIGTTLSRRRS
jgi:hypothetical protein